MPRGKGIYEDEPRDQLKGGTVSEDQDDDEAPSEHAKEPPD